MSEPNENLKDYYYVLGVLPDATQAQVQSAFQDLYDKFGPHVTMNESDPEPMMKAFKDINEAWEVLGDPVSRKEYDKVFLPVMEKNNVRNLWGKLTGVKTGDAAKTKDDPVDTRITLEITLREAIKGGLKRVTVEDTLFCQNCVKKKPVDRTKCINCHGAGLIRADRVEEVKLRTGLYDGEELCLPGKGRMDTRCRRYGDLVIVIQLAPHPYFSVQGKDISCYVPVTLCEAILGGEIETPTPTGKVAIKIQPLTQPKRVYRLKGQGLGFGQERGDFLLTMEVLIPTCLHADEVELFRRLQVVSSQPNPRREIFARLAAKTQAANPTDNANS